ncbi:carboxymuconolactone decarboxylase family protein [Paenibacillus sp. GSMTC-2017]|uniref:carboxymuconolactone decarboxylase family protein n=1 Tax=Paenibacillus sp. GSMTC-2017 TaxID=2794350 RepID=UPI0018D8D758|nr:carboxymuconolactone decarboxylase family protein [Paenibacillus sp. GSMTC-2017]MBH5319554.1 carboxymuconolactone decarboxylase family protein [Paenibacillus sp. GSMTC-2017]
MTKSSYYQASDLSRIPLLVKLAPEAATAFLAFEHKLYQETNAIPLKTKELIAIAVAHVTGCPYCIDVHVRRFKGLGGTMEEIVEAIMVAASTRSGAILSHGVQAIAAYERASAPVAENNAEPECFC